ncbi:MAG: hypothetical protein LBI42_06065 [Chitinispirillales bacterium]|jgi:flagellin|nr:hypothetical protein [Chitinispirillales bacterium]
MRINHNMMAINTHRQLGISSTDGAKSMEKLSSGLRINRAGDDAAGLAISEKMRGQIRGLNQASRNSQDTISLIQTAEGALAETHAILQRMRELSVQAANDTNTDADRFELQSEIKQLKSEVDRIANSTEFNTRKLLEGSARGIAEEIKGTFRLNNNSGVVVDSEDIKALSESIKADNSWKFDGAYMVVKVNQTKDNGVNVYNANDFKLIAPDGKDYSFVELSVDTKVEANTLKAGTIISGSGQEIIFSVPTGTPPPASASGDYSIGEAAPAHITFTSVGRSAVDAAGNITTVTVGVLILSAYTDHTEITAIGASSALASGSSITIRTNREVVLNSVSTGATAIRYTNEGKLEVLGSAGAVLKTVEVGRSITLDDGTVLKNEGGGKVTVVSGMLELGGAVTLGINASAYHIAPQSELNVESTLLKNPGSTTLIQASNYVITTAGAFNVNVTVGNSRSLTTANITNLKAGSVLARGSDVTIACGELIILEVNGKNLEVTWDSVNEILKVGDSILAPGKSITLNDGTVLTHSENLNSVGVATGKITVTSGSIKLVQDIATATAGVGNVTNYTIAKDSTIAAGSNVAAGTTLMAGTVMTTSDTFFAGSVTLSHGGTSMQFSANYSNTLAASYFETNVGESLTFVFSSYTPAANSINDSVMAQVGANSGQTAWVSMGDMRCKALGIDKVDISSKWGAAVAIETVNNALQKVSHQRASLGAMQNRLEHTIKNLDTAAENLQASESRIRDVDMAKEIMEHTKNSILQQASQAMLAQANQAPQSVLQLLRG